MGLPFFSKGKESIHPELKRLHELEEELTRDSRYAEDIAQILQHIDSKLNGTKLTPKQLQKIKHHIDIAEKHAKKELSTVKHNLEQIAHDANTLDKAA